MLVILLVRSASKKLRRYKRIGASETPSESGRVGRPICVSKLKKGKRKLEVSSFLNFKFGFHKIKMSDKVKPYHPFYPYLRWESNPNLKFRKLPFYPLNYRGKQE